MFRFFEGLISPFPEERPTRPPSGLWTFIWHYARPFKWVLLALVITSALIGYVEVMAFDLVGNAVDWMAGADDAASFWAEHGAKIIIFCGILAIVWPLMTLLDDLLLLQGVLSNFAMAIRWRGHRYLLRQSTSFFAEDFAGRITTKLMQSALGVREVMIKLTGLCVYILVYFIAAIILFAQNDLALSIPIVIWFVAYVAVLVFFLPRLQKWSKASSDARSNLTGRIVDAYTNIQTVKLFSSTQSEEAYAKRGMSDLLDVFYPQFRVVTLMSFSLHAINGLLVAGTIGLGVWLWSTGAVSVGAVAFAGGLIMRIQGLSHYFLWELSAVFENIGAVQDGMGTLARPLEITDAEDAKPLTDVRGEICFDAVSFHYGKEKHVMSDLTVTVRPGEKVGIVGRSGAGKSTLMNLLLRLYDVEGGKILIDGTNIADTTQESVRKHIAVVTQDTSLLHRSIRENIAYGREDATEEDVIAAAQRAEAWDFIQDLKDNKGRCGLDAHVGERGVKLSGGQRQRIALARVILKDAPILVLDEATSALDSEVEAAIQGRLDDIMRGKTVIAIAHRLSTIAAMDRLIVLDQGRIIEQGSHAELVESGGVYASLWARQSGGFLDAGLGQVAE
ncbi:MAG: ABC transporter ATP-binding protein [Parvularcula sp.]